MGDDFSLSFVRHDAEKVPRITVMCAGQPLQYEDVARLHVHELAASEITLFDHALVIALYVGQYRGTWGLGCREIPDLFRAEMPALDCLRTCYSFAWQTESVDLTPVSHNIYDFSGGSKMSVGSKLRETLSSYPERGR